MRHVLRNPSSRSPNEIAPSSASASAAWLAEQAQQRRLARAVRPDETDPRTRRHDEVDLGKDDMGSARFRDACGGEGAERTQRVDLRPGSSC